MRVPPVHPAVNIAGFATTIGSAFVGWAVNNQGCAAGLFPAKYAALVTLVLGAIATLWPDTRRGGITPGENAILQTAARKAQGETSMSQVGQIADALVSVLESPAVQAGLTNAIANGEVAVEKVAEAFVNGLKVNGALGIVVNALKGAVDSEIAAIVKSYSPETIAALLTKLAVQEAKGLGG